MRLDIELLYHKKLLFSHERDILLFAKVAWSLHMRPTEKKEESPHPQAEKGEVFLGYFTMAEYETIEYDTKRYGDRDNENRYPVFVNQWDVSQHIEAKKNEVLLGHFTEQRIATMAWRSKRAGQPNEAGLRPVFVSRNEYLEAMNYMRVNRGAAPRLRPPRY